MKRDVTVGPSLAESHLTILQAVSAKQNQSQGQQPGTVQISCCPLLPRPCLPRGQLPGSLLCWQNGESCALTLQQPCSRVKPALFTEDWTFYAGFTAVPKMGL